MLGQLNEIVAWNWIPVVLKSNVKDKISIGKFFRNVLERSNAVILKYKKQNQDYLSSRLYSTSIVY